MGVLGFDLVTALDLQRTVVGGSAGGGGQGTGVITVTADNLGQRDRLSITRRRYRNRHLHRARCSVGIMYSYVQRIARLEAISRRLVAAVGEEVHLRARRAAGRGDLGRNGLSRALVVGLVLIIGGDRVAVTRRDGAVPRDGSAVAVGIDGAGEHAGIRCGFGKCYLLGLGSLSGERQY